MRPDEHGLTFLPFFAGERSPGWRGRATATVHGMTLATSSLDMLRAGMESVALRLGLIFERLLPLLTDSSELDPGDIPVVAGGGALTASPVWTQMVADVLGFKVERCELEETSSRGVALLALEVIDPAFDARGAAVPGTMFHPDPGAYSIYRSARERQVRLYEAIRDCEAALDGIRGINGSGS